VGGYSEGNKKKAVVFSLVYVLGLSLTFTIFGVAAPVAGQFMSFAGRWLYIGFAATAIIMGLHLVGLLSFQLPFQNNRNVKKKGLYGAFLLGVVTGTVSSPCATPVLAVILTYAATEGDVLYGGSLLFSYALGHCALIFLAGLSVGIAESLIKSRIINNFSFYTKKASGALLVIIGVYMLIFYLYR
jgi:cytochrome c-type biogenesis protein